MLQAGKHAGADPYADADKAFEAIEALKPNVVKNYNTGSELVNLISTGEAKVAITQDFVLSSLRSAVPTMAWADLKDGDIAVLNTVNIPKGSENVELAHQFINFILSPEIQQQLAIGQWRARAHAGEHRTLWQETAAGRPLHQQLRFGNEVIDHQHRRPVGADRQALQAALRMRNHAAARLRRAPASTRPRPRGSAG